MAKVLISDKISESAIQIFKNNNIEVDTNLGFLKMNYIISSMIMMHWLFGLPRK